MKRPVPLYDFKAFGAAIKAARTESGDSRKKVSDELYISPRYLANIENRGQQPSLQVFYDLVTCLPSVLKTRCLLAFCLFSYLTALLRRGFYPTSSRPVTGGPDFRAFLIAQLPLSLLLTRKRVFIFL